MKNMVKGLGLIAFAVIIGFGVMACGEDSSGEDSPSKDPNSSNSNYLGNVITITGIPAKYNGWDATIICAEEEEGLEIYGNGKINNRTATFELINEGNGAEWEGTGLFKLILHITNPKNEESWESYVYTDGNALPASFDLLPQYDIYDPVSTISFNKFMSIWDEWWN